MEINRRTLITVGAATGIGFLGDLIVYSIVQKKLTLPKGKELVTLLVSGIAIGFAIDFLVKQIDKSQMSPEEMKLASLVYTETKAIQQGQRSGQVPVKVDWVKQA